MGAGPGLDNIRWGSQGGNFEHTLTVAQLPGHTHGFNVDSNSDAADGDDPDSSYPAVAPENIYASTKNTQMAQMTSQSTGNGQAFNIRDPYLGLIHCIALQGVFPSRN